MMLISIFIVIAGVVIAIINIFLKDASERRKNIKKISNIIAAVAIVLSGIIQIVGLSIDTPDIRFDTYGKRVTFEVEEPVYVSYKIRHDLNADPKWEKYGEDAPLFIDQVPTYLEFRSDLWLSHSASEKYTFRKDENGEIQIVPGFIGIGSGIEDVDWTPDTLYGWGPKRPLYSMDNPASKIVFNSISDNDKEIGDELYFVSASEYTGDPKNNHWTDRTYVEEDHEYVIRIYVHNNAASDMNLTAQDVRAFITLPNEYARVISVRCLISCPDADPEKIWDGTNFYSDDEREFALEYVEDTLRYYNNAGKFRLQDETKGEYSAFTNKGVLLGFDEMDGVIPGCIQYSGYISFHVKPLFKN